MQCPGDHLWAVVHPQVHRCAADRDQCADGLDDLIGSAGPHYAHREGLAGVLVDDVERLELAAVMGGVELEVDGPHLVGVDNAEPMGVLGAGPAPLPGADRTTQPFLAPEPLDPFVVHGCS